VLLPTSCGSFTARLVADLSPTILPGGASRCLGDFETRLTLCAAPGRIGEVSVSQAAGDNRFRDPRTHIYALAMADIIVVCQRCAGAAVVRTEDDQSQHWHVRPRRLHCLSCAYTMTWDPATASRWGGPFDPFFGWPLWLQASCCGGKTLWAFNPEHLDLIEGYVRARLRERRHERAYTSLLEKLPAWIKSAKNRDDVLRTIRRLRATMPGDV